MKWLNDDYIMDTWNKKYRNTNSNGSSESLQQWFNRVGNKDKELIKKRIRQDENQQRDKKLALDTMDEFSDFINKNYENAMRITTDNKNVEEVAKEILEIIDDYILKNNLQIMKEKTKIS